VITHVTALIAIGAGLLINPAVVSVFGNEDWREGVSLWLSLLWALPFIGSLVVLLATRTPRAAFYAALLPLLGSVLVHVYVFIASRSDPLAGVLLYFLAWPNLLLIFPLGLWVGVRQHDKYEAVG
jgi:hypothetical protein